MNAIKQDMTLLVGTVGQGVPRSSDGGATWESFGLTKGLHFDAIVRVLANHPSSPLDVYAGTDQGLYLSHDGGNGWARVDCLLNDRCVYAIEVDPFDPKTLYAGTGIPSTPGVFKSTDHGMSWEDLPVEVAEECPYLNVPRVIAIAANPVAAGDILVGIEVDGVRRSRDGGAAWSRIPGAAPNPDVHNVAIANDRQNTMYVLMSDRAHASRDAGKTWDRLQLQGSPLGYPRGVAVRPDRPETVFLTLGDTTPGRTGGILRTRDAGESWEALQLPCEPNSALWLVRVQKEDPDLVLAASRYGQLFWSSDGGDNWQKLWREFSEISSLLWIPSA